MSDFDRHYTDIDASRDFTQSWARFEHTRFGGFIKEHTPLVRMLAAGDKDARRLIVAMIALPPLLLLFIALMTGLAFLAMIAFVLLIVLGAIALCLWHLYDASPQQAADRFLTNEHLLTQRASMQLLSDRALSHDADHALPSIRATLDRNTMTKGKPISPHLAGVLLGECHSRSVWLSTERPVYVLAPPRGGKSTNVVIPFIVEAPGPVVATSSRKDILDATFELRTQGFSIPGRRDCDGDSPHCDGDRAFVFDPLGIVDDIPEYANARIHWNPVPSCKDPKKARDLASALVSSAQFSAEDATWARIGVDITQALLLAAALSGKGLDTVFLWSQDTLGINTARSILEAHTENRTAQDWAAPLARLSDDDRRTASNKLLTMSSAFSALSLPKVREWFTPHGDQEFDMRRFLRSRQTVYMLSELRPVTGQADASTAVFNCMFLNDVRDTARQMAAREEYGKLEPSVAMILDECANVSPWAQLPQLFTAGSGDGIWPLAVFQSRPQAKAVYKGEEAQMWDSGQKVILGGLAERSTLTDISKLSGQYREVFNDHSYRTNMLGVVSDVFDNMSTSERHELTGKLSEDDIRTIPQGCALLISHSVPAAAVSLIPYWRRGWKPGQPTGATWTNAPTMTVM